MNDFELAHMQGQRPVRTGLLARAVCRPSQIYCDDFCEVSGVHTQLGQNLPWLNTGRATPYLENLRLWAAMCGAGGRSGRTDWLTETPDSRGSQAKRPPPTRKYIQEKNLYYS